MQKAQKRDACLNQQFWFRKNVTEPQPNGAATEAASEHGIENEYELMTIDHIINGKEGTFPGLVPLIHSYLASMDVDTDTHCTIQQYLRLIQRRASGALLTTASWIRKEVLGHPEYK